MRAERASPAIAGVLCIAGNFEVRKAMPCRVDHEMARRLNLTTHVGDWRETPERVEEQAF